jgi:hypothetical protein
MSGFKPFQLAILTISALVLVPACSDDVSAPDESQVPSMTLEQLASAPETLDRAQQEYRLESDLWRDFMPISPKDGKPMIAVARLKSTDQKPIPSDVKLIYLWVVNGDRVWATAFSEQPVRFEDALQRVARGGPKWGPSISVDVVVGVMIGSELRLVRASSQPITGTY